MVKTNNQSIAFEDEAYTKVCPFCRQVIHREAITCNHCHERLVTVHTKSNGTAAMLGCLLGPVGLWYKRQWAAGFAWIVFAFLFFAMTGGLGVIFLPVFWIGMTIHAGVAKEKE